MTIAKQKYLERHYGKYYRIVPPEEMLITGINRIVMN